MNTYQINKTKKQPKKVSKNVRKPVISLWVSTYLHSVDYHSEFTKVSDQNMSAQL